MRFKLRIDLRVQGPLRDPQRDRRHGARVSHFGDFGRVRDVARYAEGAEGPVLLRSPLADSDATGAVQEIDDGRNAELIGRLSHHARLPPDEFRTEADVRRAGHAARSNHVHPRIHLLVSDRDALPLDT